VTATGVVHGLLYLGPAILNFFIDPDWQRFLYRTMPGTAGQAVMSTVDLGTLPIRPISGLIVAAIWSFVTLGIGAAVFCARDV
jgi:ABC-2 type transport system permease protein